jgi:hypothetical protein
MLTAEAHWIGKALGELEAGALSPLLNVGSATADFREKVQPYIDQEIFAPLRTRGVAVEHLDIQEGDGIDLRGDLNDDDFVASLGSRNYRALLCCNLLEHVSAPVAVCAKLERLVPARGYLILTVPNRFPYHPDPIDTMFRPNVDELVRLFRQCRLVRGEIIGCGTAWDYVERNPMVLFAALKRRIAGMKEHGGVKGSASFLPWIFKQFRETCVVLQKQA